MTELAIVTGPRPDEQVLFAASELKRYVSRLFGVTPAISREPQSADSTVFLDADSAGVVQPKDEQTFLLLSLNHNTGSWSNRCAPS